MIHNIQESRDRVRYGSRDIEYYIKKSKRIRTSELIVDSDKIEVRTPLNKTIEDTRDIVLDKAEWIFRKQSALKSSIPEIVKLTFDKNSTLPYLGRNYHLRVNANQSRITLTFASGKFGVNIITSRIDDSAKSIIRQLYSEWLIEMAYPILKSKVKKFSEKLNVDTPKILRKI